MTPRRFPFHASTPHSLQLALEVREPTLEHLTFAAVPSVAAAFETVTVTMDGATVLMTWHAGEPLEFIWELAAGTHRLVVDAGGLWPAQTVTLPATVSAITGIIPTISDVATAKPEPAAPWLAPGANLPNLTSIFPSAFVRNTHRTSFARFFEGAGKLTAVPEALFFPTIYVETFEGVFAHSGITNVSGQLFNCTPLVTNFSECFFDTPLAAVPEELFGETPLAHDFTRAFADTAITTVPEGLFAAVAKGGIYTETFARTHVTEVPAELMAFLEPANVDGMFMPPETVPYDPVNVKTAARLPDEFLRDTQKAVGVPTLPFF